MTKPVFHRDLRKARFLPRTAPIGPRALGVLRKLSTLTMDRPPSNGLIARVNADVSVRVFRSSWARHPAPALLWIHGGGYVLGSASQDDRGCRHLAHRLGIVVASVEYRLAPEHPFPTPLEDCHAALLWLAAQPDVDPARVAIGGASAGGGLAAALTLLAKERATEPGAVSPVFQLLAYPMLDDRTAARTDIDQSGMRMWNQTSNRIGWRAYLGEAADHNVPPLAAPARYKDLSGLPPAWIGVGSNDLFHDEDIAYAERLREAGVATTLHVVPGAYHGFDRMEPKAGVSRAFLEAQSTALRDAGIAGDAPPEPADDRRTERPAA
ncbi:alpha/beta hydrolase [Yinghuangia sp. ASG 101]|uniref:alpha/beta hydrolase n=1 Tax=Yinghuangia sp. ASG 101 TaxID=2896848 RepID=UPI001E551EF3|nr:alpha/beta hydrolase [Yinghuangia sp. ASG 101]UGQ12497.1 alpha/beta hydrolase [Yinghuangia sp. ASG 101]